MKFHSFFQIPASVVLLLAISLLSAIAATPVVTNVHGKQRPDTHLVDVYYDLADADSSSVSVRLQVSADGGSDWTVVPVVNVSQAVGANVTPGHGKHILWNAGTDWNGQVSKAVLFKVIASDTAPAPDGFALIPAGSFSMGDSLGDGSPYEVPAHTVNVSAFFMAKNLVTKADWDDVRTWGVNNGYGDLAAGDGKAARHPVFGITWYDMVKWCNAKSEKYGLTACYKVSGNIYRMGSSDTATCNWTVNGYRLPTEAEWEKAARGGLSGKRFSWGDTISHSQANYFSLNGSSSSYSYDVSPTVSFHPTYADGVFPYSSPVGSFAANGYGLFDMVGNEWERCWDWYASYSAVPQTDPHGASSGSNRVSRGGSYYSNANSCRSAYRHISMDTGNPYGNVGFRVARSSVP